MKANPNLTWPGWLLPLALFLLLTASAQDASADQANAPVITSAVVEGTNVVVTIQVPAGVQRVTLECRDHLDAGTWTPRAVARLDGAGGTQTFRLVQARPFEMMRVRAEMTDSLPASFYTGTNIFYGQYTGNG